MYRYLFPLFIAVLFTVELPAQRDRADKAVYLEDISWTKARELMTAETVVVIPLGAAAKEHGPHLPLSTDFLQAVESARRLALERKLIIAPPINFGYYPVFIKYAGSTCLSFTTSVESIVQIVRSLSQAGPRRFYIINVGISTIPTLQLAAKVLAKSGILLFYSDYDRLNFGEALNHISTMKFGGHADDQETSTILAVRPDLVNMSLAVNDSSVKGKRGVWSPVPLEGGIVNTSGIAGYAALGTKEMGTQTFTAFVRVMVAEIDSISRCALPSIAQTAGMYQKYQGQYISMVGDTLLINQSNNTLDFVMNHRDLRNFYSLSEEAEDYFVSLPLHILFVKNDHQKVEKAWCQYNGRAFWVTKLNP